jgi:hypothetical protein
LETSSTKISKRSWHRMIQISNSLYSELRRFFRSPFFCGNSSARFLYDSLGEAKEKASSASPLRNSRKKVV